MQINYISEVKNNAPSFTLGTNAGTGTAAQINIAGDDTFGLITVNTGDNPCGEKVCSVAFQDAYGTDNLIIELNPYNRAAQGLKTAAEAIEGTGFEINCSEELNDNAVYQWTYRVTKIN